MGLFSIGVDLGGTNLRVAAYTNAKGLIDVIQIPIRRREGRDAVISDLCEAVETLQLRAGACDQLVGIGVATPGPMELPEGRLLDPPNLPGWGNFHLRQEFESRLKRAVIVENDANVATLAECVLGQGRELSLDSLCMLTLGTGVGSGIVLNGEIWHGMNGMAGESGHVSTDPEGPMCGCGTRGCLELSASATGLVRAAQERISTKPESGLSALFRTKPNLTAADLSELARDGDVDAIEIFETLGRALGRGLASLVNSLNLPLYVIGGGVATGWDLFAVPMFDELMQGSSVYRLTDPKRAADERMAKANTHVLPAKLGSNAGILGACLLPFSSKRTASSMREANPSPY